MNGLSVSRVSGSWLGTLLVGSSFGWGPFLVAGETEKAGRGKDYI